MTFIFFNKLTFWCFDDHLVTRVPKSQTSITNYQRVKRVIVAFKCCIIFEETRVYDTNQRELMHPVCALVIFYMMIAAMSTARSFLRAKPVGHLRVGSAICSRLSSLLFYLHFTQVRFAFLSSVTNEPVCEAATKPCTSLAAGRRQRKSMLAH